MLLKSGWLVWWIKKSGEVGVVESVFRKVLGNLDKVYKSNICIVECWEGGYSLWKSINSWGFYD